MPKNFGKYFIAVVPEGELQEMATDLKLQLKEKFNLKYALKSPAHITLKMPFLWNEAKEEALKERLSQFFQDQPGFEIILHGMGRFGRRVIYVRVETQEKLKYLQHQLSLMCKTGLKLKQELSDYAYHPHMTLAFKDVKPKFFQDYYSFISDKAFRYRFHVNEVALLKREEGRWLVWARFPLDGATFK